jgi:hypothetical protein
MYENAQNERGGRGGRTNQQRAHWQVGGKVRHSSLVVAMHPSLVWLASEYHWVSSFEEWGSTYLDFLLSSALVNEEEGEEHGHHEHGRHRNQVVPHRPHHLGGKVLNTPIPLWPPGLHLSQQLEPSGCTAQTLSSASVWKIMLEKW